MIKMMYDKNILADKPNDPDEPVVDEAVARSEKI